MAVTYIHPWGFFHSLVRAVMFFLLSDAIGIEATTMCLPFSYSKTTSPLLLLPV